MGLSGLNAHRFKYNLIDNKSCPNCTSVNEDTYHFLFICPTYAAQRATLLESLTSILNTDIINNNTALERTVIFGSRELDITTNLAVFSSCSYVIFCFACIFF